jgi:hypothetical protein
MKIIILVVILLFIIVNKDSFTSTQNVYVVSFAHECCELAQENLEKTAIKYGATKVYNLNLKTLKAPPDVKEYIRTNKRGAGYWIWKPYCLQQILDISNPGDIVIYTDSSAYFTKSLKNIINFINKNNIFVLKHPNSNGFSQSKWTKGNAVKYFNDTPDWCKTEGKYIQFIASIVGIKKNETGKKLVNFWLDALQTKNAHLFDDSKSENNCEDFNESRHDQQMLSLILYKYFKNIPYGDNNNKYGFARHTPINGVDRHK